jgi:hypothetical protein
LEVKKEDDLFPLLYEKIYFKPNNPWLSDINL